MFNFRDPPRRVPHRPRVGVVTGVLAITVLAATTATTATIAHAEAGAPIPPAPPWQSDATAMYGYAPAMPPESQPIGLTASAGMRSDLVASAGLDPFAATDSIPQTALAVGYRFGHDVMSGIGVAFEWDHGNSTATARGTDTSLTVDRLSLGLDARVAIRTRLAAFARLAPGLMRHHASFNEPAAPPPAYQEGAPGALQQTAWVPAADLSGGLVLRIGDVRPDQRRTFTFLVVGEGGYGLARAHDLTVASNHQTPAGRTDEPVHLGRLAFSGMFLRLYLALSF
ncbi:MAG: hypothetical protein ABI560_10815 [Myxococcales bacterium]